MPWLFCCCQGNLAHAARPGRARQAQQMPKVSDTVLSFHLDLRPVPLRVVLQGTAAKACQQGQSAEVANCDKEKSHHTKKQTSRKYSHFWPLLFPGVMSDFVSVLLLTAGVFSWTEELIRLIFSMESLSVQISCIWIIDEGKIGKKIKLGHRGSWSH